MKISRILHAGYIFESGRSQILFDPIFENPFSRNCYAYPDVQFDHRKIMDLCPDAIFISHYHDDHCSFESLQYLNRAVPVYLYCVHQELFTLLRDLGFEKVYKLETDLPVKVGAFEVVPRLALDPDVDSIFEIKAEGLNVLNVVDAWIDPLAFEYLTAVKWDLILWPFQTMRETEVIAPELALPPELPAEWLDQLRLLNPRFVVPSSCQFIHEEWSWYRQAYFPISYRQFQSAVERVLPAVRVCRMNPGVTFELSGKGLLAAEALPWVVPLGSQDVDYDYDPQVTPAPTGDIARHFQPVTEPIKKRVLDFCKKELIERYDNAVPLIDGCWKLALFDHQGNEISLFYELKDNNMRLIEEATRTSSVTSWVTEVPLIKVYNALEEGESLSSMYVRMTGLPFDNIFEDPLVVSLFNRDYFSYQKHQLKFCVPQSK